ncbi:MAG TPA: O-antigen ligase family protein [Candidatus Methylomirabilis sp.]|nr:O-antigen ligase family protein [Candidatus Methylomirabilis sp.]
MARSDGRLLPLAALLLGAVQIALPWTIGGRSPVGQVALVLVLGLAGMIGLVLEGSSPPLRPSPLLLLAGALIVISALHTIYLDRTVQSLLLLLSYLLAATLAAHAARNDERAKPILLAGMSICGVLVSLGGMYQLLQGSQGGLYARVLTGPFGYPNAAGGFLLLTAGAALAFAREERGPATRTASMAAALVSILGLALTRSHGVMFAATVGLVIWALTDRAAWWSQRRVWAGAGGLGLLLTIALAPKWLIGLPLRVWSLFDTGTADPSFMWRLHILKWTWAMVRDHPWWGVGPGAFPVALTHYQRIPYVSGVNPHNLYLELAAELGLPTAILATLALGRLFFRMGVAVRRTPMIHPSRGHLAALLATLAAFAVHSAMDLDWSFPAIAVTAAILLGTASAQLARGAVTPPWFPVLWRWTLISLLVVSAVLGLTRYYTTTLVDGARLALTMGDTAAARADLTWALRLNPLSYLARERMAQALLRSGDPEGAIEVAERAIRIAPLDPNHQYLVGEIAAAEGRWGMALGFFQNAAERAPFAQLRFHASLVEAAALAGRGAEARLWYERAISIFTPERVLDGDARCLVPGDRYLLARMSRIASRLYAEAGDHLREQTAADHARLLARPDARGICVTSGQSDQASPESAVVSFWRALSDGGWARAERFLAPEIRTPGRSIGNGGKNEEGQPSGGRVAWIASLSGGESRANLRFEAEVWTPQSYRLTRCALTTLRLIGDSWFIERLPMLESNPCKP